MKKILPILFWGYVGYRVGRYLEQKLSTEVLIEIYEVIGDNDGIQITDTVGYIQLNAGNVSITPNLNQATAIRFDTARILKKIIYKTLPAGQEIAFVAKDSALVVPQMQEV